jgi:hypothetical protein
MVSCLLLGVPSCEIGPRLITQETDMFNRHLGLACSGYGTKLREANHRQWLNRAQWGGFLWTHHWFSCAQGSPTWHQEVRDEQVIRL